MVVLGVRLSSGFADCTVEIRVENVKSIIYNIQYHSFRVSGPRTITSTITVRYSGIYCSYVTIVYFYHGGVATSISSYKVKIWDFQFALFRWHLYGVH